MSSGKNGFDSPYERAFKLWISLWTLVLEDKRCLDAVCGALQELVFKNTKWPKFKHWPNICELGKTDKLMMLVVATCDMSRVETSKLTQRVVAMYPWCFSHEKIRGPVPWSVLKKAALAESAKTLEYANSPTSFMMSLGILVRFNIPYQDFLLDPEELSGDRGELILPESLNHLMSGGSVGVLTEWEGKRWVVAEFRGKDMCQYAGLVLVPAECVNLNM